MQNRLLKLQLFDEEQPLKVRHSALLSHLRNRCDAPVSRYYPSVDDYVAQEMEKAINAHDLAQEMVKETNQEMRLLNTRKDDDLPFDGGVRNDWHLPIVVDHSLLKTHLEGASRIENALRYPPKWIPNASEDPLILNMSEWLRVLGFKEHNRTHFFLTCADVRILSVLCADTQHDFR